MIWRHGERFFPLNVVEHDRYEGGSVMLWAGSSKQQTKTLFEGCVTFSSSEGLINDFILLCIIFYRLNCKLAQSAIQ